MSRVDHRRETCHLRYVYPAPLWYVTEHNATDISLNMLFKVQPECGEMLGLEALLRAYITFGPNS